MRVLRVVAILAAVVLAPVLALAQTPCDGAAPTSFFVVPATGAAFVFPYPTQDHDTGVVSYTLSLKRQAGGPVVSTQVVTKAATTALGTTATAGISCYSIPVVPVGQIPRGAALLATLTANAATPELSSAEGSATAPFGSPLTAPALRPRP